MKIVNCSDPHIRYQAPRCRTDNYFETMLRKLSWVVSKVEEKAVLVLPGDIFDSHKAPDILKYKFIEIFKKIAGRVLVVPGQHDQRFHTQGIENIPLGIPIVCDIAVLLRENPIYFLDEYGEATYFYGAPWGTEIPDITTPDEFNVLVIHAMISDKDYWASNLEFTDAKELLEAYDFDLILSGDNHKPFVIKSGRKTLINGGSLMRSSIDQMDHEPSIMIFDTHTRKYEKLYIPIEPAEDVMKIEDYEKEKEKNENLELFIKSLPEFLHSRKDLNYVGVLEKLLKEVDDTEIDELIWEAIGE